MLHLLQAAERLYYIYQTMLDTSKALEAAAAEGHQPQQQALQHLQVCHIACKSLGLIQRQIHLSYHSIIRDAKLHLG